MTLLIVGLVVWSLAHAFKRAVPGERAALTERLGAGPSRGIMALLIAAGLVLMIIGYRAAPYIAVYTPPGWTVHLNNLLMLIAVLLFGASHSRSRIKGWLRNPMLTAVVIWAVAHLLVNGDLASLVLFGGLGTWAVVTMAMIDGAGDWTPPVPGPVAAEARLGLITIVTFGAIVMIHTWLGYPPFLV
ncbi:NnrU family protein [uncultured Amaricoccus sp.]|uniref:NnrU family protein n=1 Tax=uncultured Amaricoccus sp. TaxID=339341 RepID=UPI0026351E82|nr:NnrU family protein [uncultured Amaricoccus sp.]